MDNREENVTVLLNCRWKFAKQEAWWPGLTAENFETASTVN